MKIASPESVGISSDRLQRINTKMQDYVDNKNVPGFITLIARKGQVIHYETCGQRDVEHGLPMEKDTIFRIYSMTKPITSVALMMLYEQGKFQLFDPVSKYIPEFGKTKVLKGMSFMGPELVGQETPMTIHHLLTHTAGLSYGFYYDSIIDEQYRHSAFRDPSLELGEKMRRMASLPLRFQPGTHWFYSIATDVCGYLVEVLSDMPFQDFLQENIFDPLGMIDTAFYVSEDKLDRFAALYQHNFLDGSFHLFEGSPHIPKQKFTVMPNSPSGGGGLISTTEDYLKFAQMMANKGELEGIRLLGRRTIEYMAQNHLKPELMPFGHGSDMKYGMGFGLGVSMVLDPAQTEVMSSVGNYGWGGAAATNFWVDPVEDMVCIIMTQLMDNMLPFQSDFRVLTYQAMVE